MDIEGLTLGQMREIARLVQGIDGGAPASPAATGQAHSPIPVVVCTDKRGVVFGYCENTSARPIALTQARMCLYWSADVGGVFGLGEKGPTKGLQNLRHVAGRDAGGRDRNLYRRSSGREGVERRKGAGALDHGQHALL